VIEAANALPVEHLFTLSCTTAPAIEISDAPGGNRLLLAVTGGSFEGERLRGTVVPSPGGDWAIREPDGTVRIDVRLVLQPDTGGPILLTYAGVAVRTHDGVSIRTAGRFVASAGPHSWLNSVQAVGHGRVGDRRVTYDIYRLL
jgi:hypothetical protein